MSDDEGWVKVKRGSGPLCDGCPPYEIVTRAGAKAALYFRDDQIVPASELQRVTPSLPQTEQEWKQCADERRRAQTGFGAAVDSWHTILGVYGDTLWMTYPDGDGTDTWNCCNVVALDPPWVPERDPNIQEAIEVLTTEQIRLAGPPPQFGGRKWREGVVIARGCAADAVDAALTCLHRVGAVGDGER